ncbi:tyrosine-type recombinase/integrase [Humidesulfovibrio idahonensis]
MAYKINSHGKVRWRGKRQINGVVYQGNFPTKREAEAWEAEMRASGTQFLTVREIPTVAAWIDATLDAAKRSGRAVSTMKEKDFAFKMLRTVIDPMAPVTDIDAKVALNCLLKRKEKSGAKAANKDRKNLAAAWKWGIPFFDLPEKNPFKVVARFGEDQPKRYVPPVEDFWKLYDAAETHQDRTMLIAYHSVAARKSELFRLRWEDIDFENGLIRLFTRKRLGGGMAYEWLSMTDQLSWHLAEQKRQALHPEFAFICPQTLEPYDARNKWMKTLCEKAGVKHFGLHAIRHLAATLMDHARVPMADIQQTLRHKSPNTTGRYVHSLQGSKVKLDAVFERPTQSVTQGKSKTPEALCFEGLTGSANGFRNAVPE